VSVETRTGRLVAGVGLLLAPNAGEGLGGNEKHSGRAMVVPSSQEQLGEIAAGTEPWIGPICNSV
jgi:hypothetical protein